ncbi:hypothetical protein BDV39DRAFT_210265 [Aspergillus sergii]|uniref:Uncharacterized protein n=1 Tax=Aspergillus sergii TaxID=1034303 RepID=A0A5N6WMU2_9EURO|nr:hypothetical protein BDV39DRAFT_210265 [Aspergillus sergii]
MHRTDNGLTPEELITTTTPAPNSYTNSQIAGPVRSPSLWNKAEWFPSLVLSSLHVGALPDTLAPALDRIDWVPSDLLAAILVNLALKKK